MQDQLVGFLKEEVFEDTTTDLTFTASSIIVGFYETGSDSASQHITIGL